MKNDLLHGADNTTLLNRIKLHHVKLWQLDKNQKNQLKTFKNAPSQLRKIMFGGTSTDRLTFHTFLTITTQKQQANNKNVVRAYKSSHIRLNSKDI